MNCSDEGYYDITQINKDKIYNIIIQEKGYGYKKFHSELLKKEEEKSNVK